MAVNMLFIWKRTNMIWWLKLSMPECLYLCMWACGEWVYYFVSCCQITFMIFPFILCVLYFESHSGDVTWASWHLKFKGITWWAGNSLRNVSVIRKVFPYHYVFWIRPYQPISPRQSRDTNSTTSFHYSDVIMGAIASQITGLTIVYWTNYSDADQRKHQSSASLAFVREFIGDRWFPRTNGQ